MKQHNCIIVRGGGDLATGVIQALWRAGFPVVSLEVAAPSAIRRQVALSEAVYDGRCTVEDMTAVRCHTYEDVQQAWEKNQIPLMIDPEGKAIADLKPAVVVDAILAKKNLGTTRDMAPCVIGLGPGFMAGCDVDYVIETKRGHNLGRIITDGTAAANTGIPGIIAGYGKERVMHSPAAGYVYGLVRIGDMVEQGDPVAIIIGTPQDTVSICTEGMLIRASLTGLVRGLIRDGYPVTPGFKTADIDPRKEELKNCFTISDKARCLGGAVLTAVLMDQKKKGVQKR